VFLIRGGCCGRCIFRWYTTHLVVINTYKLHEKIHCRKIIIYECTICYYTDCNDNTDSYSTSHSTTQRFEMYGERTLDFSYHLKNTHSGSASAILKTFSLSRASKYLFNYLCLTGRNNQLEYGIQKKFESFYDVQGERAYGSGYGIRKSHCF
jgi:hypothetical protein